MNFQKCHFQFLRPCTQLLCVSCSVIWNNNGFKLSVFFRIAMVLTGLRSVSISDPTVKVFTIFRAFTKKNLGWWRLLFFPSKLLEFLHSTYFKSLLNLQIKLTSKDDWNLFILELHELKIRY